MITHSDDPSAKLVSLSASVTLSFDVNGEADGEITVIMLESEELKHSSEVSESEYPISENRA